MERDKKHIDNELRKIKASRTSNWIGCQLLPILVMVYIVLALFLPPLLNKKSSVWESRAKATLRAFGEVQLAYQRVNIEEYYGSWDALKRTGFIKDGFTQGTIIENYSLYIRNQNYYPYTGSLPVSGGQPSFFTAVAFPLVTRPPGYLATFVIREDQTLRVYRDNTPGAIAWGDGGDFGGMTWEPIR